MTAIDPTAVKAGDTGAWFGVGDSVRYVGKDSEYFAVDRGVFHGRVYTVRHHTMRRDGVISLAGVHGMWPAREFELVSRATAHQPAPKPEWKPGTVHSARHYMATDPEPMWFRDWNGAPRFVTAAGEDYPPDEVEDVRPLVVIDPAEVVDELVDSLSHALGERLPAETLAFINRVSDDDRRKWVRGLLAHAQPNLVRSAFQVLGIEVSR